MLFPTSNRSSFKTFKLYKFDYGRVYLRHVVDTACCLSTLCKFMALHGRYFTDKPSCYSVLMFVHGIGIAKVILLANLT